MIRPSTIYRIAELVETDPLGQSMDELFKSLSEEFGEVARIVNGKPHDEPLGNELCDVIICSMAMYYQYLKSIHNDTGMIYRMAEGELDDVINSKLDKWESKNIAASQLEEPIQ